MILAAGRHCWRRPRRCRRIALKGQVIDTVREGSSVFSLKLSLIGHRSHGRRRGALGLVLRVGWHREGFYSLALSRGLTCLGEAIAGWEPRKDARLG